MSSITIEMLNERVEALEKQIACLLKKSDDTKSTTTTKNTKVKKDKKSTKKASDSSSDDDQPKKKKRLSGYIIYSNTHRDQVKSELADGDEKPKNTEVMKRLAAMWKDLNEEEKEEWNTKAKELADVE